MASLRSLARALVVAFVLSAIALPVLGLSLEVFGFKAPDEDYAFAYRGTDASGAVVRGPDGKPTVVYFLHPSQASARAVLASLERFRGSHGDTIAIVAISPSARADLATILKDLRLGFPVLSSAIVTGSTRAGATPIFLILAPDGRPVGVRTGSLDWSGAGASALAAKVLEAYPPDRSALSAAPAPAGAPAGAAPSPGAPATPSSSNAPIPQPSAAPPPGTGAPTASVSFLSAVESEVVAELNLARQAPVEYAAFLREYRSFIRGKMYEKPGKIAVVLNEGAKAVDEAIAFLEKQKPLKPLSVSKGMSRAAKDLASDQGKSGATGHSGSDGSSPFDRMERYGSWKRLAGENCAYGGETGREIVIQLIVDDGVASRGHRANIFNPDFAVVGVAVGPHPGYRVVCVQDFAGGYAEK